MKYSNKVMIPNAKILMDRVVSDYLISFNNEMDRAKTNTDYFALVTAVLVFKELIMTQFKYELELDSTDSENSVDDICQVMDGHAISMAKEIGRRISLKTAN